MITYIYMHMMSRQKLIIYVISILVIDILACLFMQVNLSYTDQMINKSANQLYYEQMTLEYMHILMPLVVVMISMHHEAKALQPMYAYMQRKKVMLYKIITYVLFFIWTSILIIVPIYLLPYFFTYYYELSTTFLLKLFMTYLESMIVLAMTFICISQKHVSFAILIAIAAIIYHMFYQDHFHILLFYLCPFFHEHVLSYTYHIHYQVVYILLLLVVSYLTMMKREIC